MLLSFFFFIVFIIYYCEIINQVTFDEAHGSIRDGKLRLSDAKVSRKGSKSKDFDFSIRNFDFVYHLLKI